MFKLTSFESQDQFGNHIIPLDFSQPTSGLIKTAAEYSPEIQIFIKKLQPDTSKYVYLLINVMGAGEFYSSNLNGDYFGKEMLQRNFNTFVTNGFPFKLHVNKDPNKACGKILHAWYNPRMHRVELIEQIDKSLAPEVVSKVEAGRPVYISMGCKVPYDTCSVCGNRALTTANYCNHLKYDMNRIYPDGKKVYAINPDGTFFDSSFVVIPADRTAQVLYKVAHPTTLQLSADLGEKLAEESKAAEIKASQIKESEIDKASEIEKQITGDVEESGESVKNLLQYLLHREREMDNKEIDFISHGQTPGDILGTLFGTGIIPHPKEFQRIMLVSSGNKELADRLDSEGFDISKLLGHVNQKAVGEPTLGISPTVLSRIQDLIPERSFLEPVINKRIIHITISKQAGLLDAIMGGLVASYAAGKPQDSEARKLHEQLYPAELPGYMAPLGGLAALYTLLMEKFPKLSPGLLEKITTTPSLFKIIMAVLIGKGIYNMATLDPSMPVPMEPKLPFTPIDFRPPTMDFNMQPTLMKTSGFLNWLIPAELASHAYSAYLTTNEMDEYNRTGQVTPRGYLREFVQANPLLAGLAVAYTPNLAKRLKNKFAPEVL